jgi:2-dehydro-3-deoxyphosphogalactonate aldolase
MTLQEILTKFPILANLRGITEHDVIPVVETLLEAGFYCIVIPINDAHSTQCLHRIKEKLDKHLVLAAGTVTKVEQVTLAKEAGASIIISPHINRKIIQNTKELGLISIPGFNTPTEAFTALDADADALKFFPCTAPAMLKGIKTVLADIPIIAAGGISPTSLAHYFHAGAQGFEIGSHLYQAGDQPSLVRQNAKAFTQVLQELR